MIAFLWPTNKTLLLVFDINFNNILRNSPDSTHKKEINPQIILNTQKNERR